MAVHFRVSTEQPESQNNLPLLSQQMAPYTFYYDCWGRIEEIFQGQGSISSGRRRLNDVDANPTFHSYHPSLFINLGEITTGMSEGAVEAAPADLLASNPFLDILSLISKGPVCLVHRWP